MTSTDAPHTPDQRLAMTTYVKLMRAADAVTQTMHRHLADEDLTLSQFGVLEALFSLGPLCQRDLGRKILKTRGRITMVIDQLEQRGLVRRRPNPEDRRYQIVHLTGAGRTVIERVMPRHAATAEAVFAALSPEKQRTLGRLLKRLGREAAGADDDRTSRPCNP